MSLLRTALFRLVGVVLLAVLAAGTVWYTVVVPHRRQERFHPAPNPRPTATDATATSVPPPLGRR